LKRKRITGEIYLKINIVNIIKSIISVLVMPLALIAGIIVLLISTQIVIHETLWKD